MSRYPKSATLWRAYAVFLEEIKNDLEYSQIAFRTADDVEEENARKHIQKDSIPRINKAGNQVKKFVESDDEETAYNSNEEDFVPCK